MTTRSRGTIGAQALVLASGLAAWSLLTWIYVRRATSARDLRSSSVSLELPARTQFLDRRLADQMRGRSVEFEVGRAVLTPAGRALLDELVPLILADSSARLDVNGHSDIRGSAVANLQLSDSRARAVVSYLVDHGIPASRLTPRGLGATQPMPGDTAADRQHNRYIEFRVRPGDT